MFLMLRAENPLSSGSSCCSPLAIVSMASMALLPQYPSRLWAETKPTTKHQERSRKAANKSPSPSGLDGLWSAAKASKAKKNLKESQVWVDDELYRKIELLNLKSGKPVPTKHIVNAILRMFMDEHKTEIQKAAKRT